MTSPVDAALKGPGDAVQAPFSLGWIAAHVMEGGGSSAAAWRHPLDLVRSAAAAMAANAGMAGGSLESRESGATAAEFAKPFRAAAELVGLIREPLNTKAMVPQSGIGAMAGTSLSALAALSGRDSVAMGTEADAGPEGSGNTLNGALGGPSLPGVSRDPKRDIGGPGTLGSIGSSGAAAAFAALASKGLGDLFQPPSARTSTERMESTAESRHSGPVDSPWVETGNPAPRYGSRSASQGRSQRTATPSFPPARLDLEVWAERAALKLARYVSGFASESGQESESIKPASLKRASFIPPEDPETIARFKKLIEANLQAPYPAESATASGSTMDGGQTKPAANERQAKPGAPNAGDSVSDRVVSVAFSYAGYSGPSGPGNPPAPDLSDLANALYAPVLPAADETTGDVHSPSDADRIPPRSVAAPGRDTAGEPLLPLGNGATVQRNGQSQVEWMDEEDDLAAKLHRLLRRQAKRRGVELP